MAPRDISGAGAGSRLGGLLGAGAAAHDPDGPNLLGLYEGIPLTRRGSGYFGVMPDRITLFRSTLVEGARKLLAAEVPAVTL